MTTLDTNTLNSEDILDVRDLIERVEELEDNQDTPDAKEEYIFLCTILDALCGEGGDEKWRGDWYPITLIRESYFVDYVQELLVDCGEIPAKLPSYIHIDWEATAREVMVDYTTVEIDGVTYLYR